MALLSSYYLPGLYVEDHAVDVPLDWRGTSPALLAGADDPEPSRLCSESAVLNPDPVFAGKKIRLFYRTVCLPQNVGRDLPAIVYLQGGPGGAGPRVLNAQSDGWLAEAVKHFRVVLPDQRGTGRSSAVDGYRMDQLREEALTCGADPARLQANYLKRFLADSIVRDFEYLRLTDFAGARWVTLGQSYGGFLTLCNLSTFPHGVAASFVGGGIPHVPASAKDVYAHTFPRMVSKTNAWYKKYPVDQERVELLADRLSAGDVLLPDGSPFSVRRLQLCGGGLGMKPAPERLHNLLDLAFSDGDGSAQSALAAAGSDVSKVYVNRGFAEGVQTLTGSAANPLYWTLQEFIYADGKLDEPIRWAAAHEAEARPEFSEAARPLMFYGEAMFPWMFQEDPALRPFADAMDVLMEDTEFGALYDTEMLAANEAPLRCAVYFDDLYVDSGLQLDTLSRVGNSRAWVTNEFEHDGLHGDVVFRRLFEEARDCGDLDKMLC